jgi:hypothetical protein
VLLVTTSKGLGVRDRGDGTANVEMH